MDWTVKGYGEANHNPAITVNGNAGTAPILVELRSAARDPRRQLSRDPHGHHSLPWFQRGGRFRARRESGRCHDAQAPQSDRDGDRRMPARLDAMKRSCPTGTAHVILAVTDNGSPR